MLAGNCLCGDTSFKVTGEAKGASVCHCSQCRKQSGHVWASAYVADDAIEISGTVKWFASSPTAKRGFCPTCGSVLFWKLHAESYISFSLGALNAPTNLKLEKHIFCNSKGDYYEISDALPQKD